jgi:cell division protein FtsI (penicillin-binding protein 3)
VGLREGGEVAAPVFKRVAEQVLSYLDVPRDIPVRERILTASRRTPSSNALPDVTDFSPAETSGATDSFAEFAEAASLRATAPQTVALAEGARITVPKLKGKTVREVTEECFRLGLSPVLIGTGVALEQSPDAGQPTRPGGRVTVRFGNAARRNGSGKGD